MRVQFTKWGGRRHHGAEVVYLGSDEHGDWLGDRVGNEWAGGPRPFTSVTDNVLLVPPGRGMTAMFYSDHPAQDWGLYVDITTVPVWDGELVTAVDLDLDVIRRWDGSWFVDDEDEFAEHQVSYGYPAEVVAGARAECDRVLADLRDDAAWLQPAVVEPWRDALARLR